MTDINLRLITADQVRANLKLEDLIEPMRNAFKAFSRGEQDVGCSYVGLKVDELLGRAAWGQPVRYEPQSL